MDIKEEARPVIETIGGEIFGEPDLAENALDDFDYWYKPGNRPSVAAWKVFVYYLDINSLLEEALNRALKKPNLVPYLRKFLREEDAEDAAQKAKIAAYRNFKRFEPYHPNSWFGWQYMIARSKKNDLLRKIIPENDRSLSFADDRTDVLDAIVFGTVAYDGSGPENLPQMPWSTKFEVYIYGEDSQERGWSIPIICEEWMKKSDLRRARFAAQLLLLYHNLAGWSGITGQKMQEIVGVSSSETLHRWFREFCEEVVKKEEE
jgi:hypothetical protein